MKNKNTVVNKITFCLSVFLICIIKVGYAQKSENKTNNPYSNGTIVCSENGTVLSEWHPSAKPYDEYMLGVFHEGKEAVHTATRSSVPIVSQGIVYVKYNSENGKIKKGDPITSSSTPGEGMKATKPGMIIGIALEDATDSSGLVKIRILIQYMR